VIQETVKPNKKHKKVEDSKAQPEQNLKQIFQGRYAEDNGSLLSQYTQSFIEPLLQEAQTNEIKFEQFGKLPDHMNINTEVKKLEAEWLRLRGTYPESKKSLFWAFIYLYKSYYITHIANNIF